MLFRGCFLYFGKQTGRNESVSRSLGFHTIYNSEQVGRIKEANNSSIAVLSPPAAFSAAASQKPSLASCALLASKALSMSASLASPPAAMDASSIARNAFNLASRSSTRRSPSRTTSLPEPYRPPHTPPPTQTSHPP